jgi:hypothetical protein
MTEKRKGWGATAMFEVIVTHRKDLREQVMGRYSNGTEAHESARQIARQNSDLIVRAWIREVREAKSKS